MAWVRLDGRTSVRGIDQNFTVRGLWCLAMVGLGSGLAETGRRQRISSTQNRLLFGLVAQLAGSVARSYRSLDGLGCGLVAQLVRAHA